MAATITHPPLPATDPGPQRRLAALIASRLSGAGYKPEDAPLFVRNPVLACLLAEEMELELARVASESARLILGIGS